AAVNEALSLAPQLALVQDAAARISAAVNNAEQADYHYQAAIRLAPDDPYVRQDYARFLCDQRRYAQAEAQFAIQGEIPSYLTPEVAHLDAGLCALRAP